MLMNRAEIAVLHSASRPARHHADRPPPVTRLPRLGGFLAAVATAPNRLTGRRPFDRRHRRSTAGDVPAQPARHGDAVGRHRDTPVPAASPLGLAR
jgi:hypothetical protein